MKTARLKEHLTKPLVPAGHREAEPAAALVAVCHVSLSRWQETRHCEPHTEPIEEITAADEVQHASGFEHLQRHAQPERQRFDQLAALVTALDAAHDAGAPSLEAVPALPDHPGASGGGEHTHRSRHVGTGVRHDGGAEHTTHQSQESAGGACTHHLEAAGVFGAL